MTEQAVYGMAPDVPLPEGWEPVGAVAVVRCIDPDGKRRIVTVYAGDVMAWEALGMVGNAEDDVRAHLRRAPRILPPDGGETR